MSNASNFKAGVLKAKPKAKCYREPLSGKFMVVTPTMYGRIHILADAANIEQEAWEEAFKYYGKKGT
jgi:hypothetical protein